MNRIFPVEGFVDDRGQKKVRIYDSIYAGTPEEAAEVFKAYYVHLGVVTITRIPGSRRS